MIFKKPPLRVPKSDAIKAKDKHNLEPKIAAKVKQNPKTGRPQLLITTSLGGNEVSTVPDSDLALLNSRFGNKTETIVDMIDMGNSDGASSLIVKALLQSLVEVLPMAEHNIRQSRATKGIYGFNTIVSSIRELLGDLQSLKDRASLGQSIVDKTVRPSYMDIAVQVVAAFTLLQDSAKSRMDDSDFKEFRRDLEGTKKGLSDYLMAQYKDVSEQVVKSLG